MAEKQKVYLKRSNVSGKTPTADQLQWGEVAVNYAAGSERLFVKNSSGDVISFLPDHVIIENEEVTAIALNDLDGRIKDLSAVTSTKVDKVSGKGLSTNDYTTEEKTKLAGIEALDTSDSSNKLFLVGANTQANNGATTKTNSGVYTSGSAIYAKNGFYETSDERKKEFISDIDCDLDALSKIPKKYFRWNDGDENSRYIGTSAQEVMKLYPEMVTKDDEGYLHVSYDKFGIIALAAIDKLREENKALMERIEALEKKMA